MSKKYERLAGDYIDAAKGLRLYRIRALRDIGGYAKAGTLGGYIESEANLSQEGEAWVCGEAWVYGGAEVSDKAQVCGDAQVYGGAQVYGEAQVGGDAQVFGDAEVGGKAQVYGDAQVYGGAQVYGEAEVGGKAKVYGEARVGGEALVYKKAEVYSGMHVRGNACIGSPRDIIGFFNVGSMNGTLTAYRTKGGGIGVTRGCFSGSDNDFLAAVQKKHGDSVIAQEYRLLIEAARLRLQAAQGEAR